MPIHVGCAGLPAQRARLCTGKLDAMEVLPVQELPPKVKTAKAWREQAPAGFVYSMVASRLFTVAPDQLPPGLEGEPAAYGGLRTTSEMMSLCDRTLDAAKAMEASAILFVTPSTMGPAPQVKAAFASFFGAVERAGAQLAWEPHGPWEDREIEALCEEHDLLRCFDPLRDPPPPGRAAYARLGPFASMGRAMADDELEGIVEILLDYEEAYCFFATERALDDARRLRAMCSQ